MNGSFFSSVNYKLLVLSIVLMIAGYILLGQGPVYNHLSWSVAPVVLVAVYCILLPLSVIAGEKKQKDNKKTGV